MDVNRFVLQFIRDCAPKHVTTEFRRWPDDPSALPLVIVDVGSPQEINNGPRGVGFTGDIDLSIYAREYSTAYDLANSLRYNALRLWYAGYSNKHGGISHISRGMGYPYEVDSDLEDHTITRFDFAIPIVASTHTAKE